MDAQTSQRLIDLNNEFYRQNALSFSSTRQYAWDGWRQMLEALPQQPRSVIDIACGNMRFKRFLDDALGEGSFDYTGIDSCNDLVPVETRGAFVLYDILGGHDAKPIELERQYDLVACFGFLHHVPGKSARLDLMDLLMSLLAPQGVLCVSFWQFARNEKMLDKSLKTTARGISELGLALEENDYLLGWQGSCSTYRYCHNYTDREIDEIIANSSSRATLEGRFRADGKTGDMNTYLILRSTC